MLCLCKGRWQGCRTGPGAARSVQGRGLKAGHSKCCSASLPAGTGAQKCLTPGDCTEKGCPGWHSFAGCVWLDVTRTLWAHWPRGWDCSRRELVLLSLSRRKCHFFGWVSGWKKWKGGCGMCLTSPQTPFRPFLVCFPAVSRLRSILLKVKPG